MASANADVSESSGNQRHLFERIFRARLVQIGSDLH